jgi:hemerythrin
MAHGIPSSGNLLIDRQHQQLSDLIHQAASAARDTETPVPFQQALADFRNALSHHFAVEEVIFSGAGFDAAQKHIQAHAVILHHLDTFLASVADLSTLPARHRLLDELEGILHDHETLEDAAYWDSVRAHSTSSALKWTEMMNIGIPRVDDDHRRMVALFNQVSQAGVDGDDHSALELLRQFLAEARVHFAAEERFLNAQGKPISEHRAEHTRMLVELELLLEADAASQHMLVAHYLRFWMIEHILGIDRRELVD